MARPYVSSTSHRAATQRLWKNATTKDSQQQSPTRNTLTWASLVRARDRDRERERERERKAVFWIIRECVRGFVFGNRRVRSTSEQREPDNDPLSAGDKDTAANWRDPPWLEYTRLKLSFFSCATRWLIAVHILSTSMHRPVWRKNAGPGESQAPIPFVSWLSRSAVVIFWNAGKRM